MNVPIKPDELIQYRIDAHDKAIEKLVGIVNKILVMTTSVNQLFAGEQVDIYDRSGDFDWLIYHAEVVSLFREAGWGVEMSGARSESGSPRYHFSIPKELRT